MSLKFFTLICNPKKKTKKVAHLKTSGKIEMRWFTWLLDEDDTCFRFFLFHKKKLDTWIKCEKLKFTQTYYYRIFVFYICYWWSWGSKSSLLPIGFKIHRRIYYKLNLHNIAKFLNYFLNIVSATWFASRKARIPNNTSSFWLGTWCKTN